MSIMMVTSLNTYTKNMEMKMKWQKKQAEKDYSAQKADSESGKDTTVRRQLEEIRDSRQDHSAQMAAQIDMKMTAGKRLSAKEMEYLKEHDPETYKKARAIEMEREAYERELKNCKTKEEVQRVKAAHAAAGLDQVNNIKNNPNIPSGKKLELIKQELSKSTALEDSMGSFVKSGEYKKLPTEAERLKAEKDMEEARKEELGLDQDSKEKTEQTDEEEPSGTAAADSQVSDDSTPAAGDGTSAERSTAPDHISAEKLTARGGTSTGGTSMERSAAATEAVPASKSRAGEPVRAVTEHPKTRAQAEVTPEARKVRQAKVRAAYSAGQVKVTETQTPVIDIKR